MDTKYFEYVVEIMECGSINKAAQNLQMLQPNLSVYIKNLEQELGFPIFHRQHSGIRLTNEGELFLKSVKKIAAELETIHNIPSVFSHKDNLSVSCTYSFDFMSHFLKFKKKKPSTACEDSFKGTGLVQTIRDVVGQRYRASLFYCLNTVSDTYYALARKHNLKPIPIVRSRLLILLASKKNPLLRKRETPFDNITNYKSIMYENFKLDEWLKVLNFKNDNNILYAFSRDDLTDAIRQSRYVTVMMKRFVDTYSKDCVEISTADAPFGMDAYCLYHVSYTMNSREKQFIRELKELFADHPADRPIQIFNGSYRYQRTVWLWGRPLPPRCRPPPPEPSPPAAGTQPA